MKPSCTLSPFVPSEPLHIFKKEFFGFVIYVFLFHVKEILNAEKKADQRRLSFKQNR